MNVQAFFVLKPLNKFTKKRFNHLIVPNNLNYKFNETLFFLMKNN
ncbi:hypothetical protein SAMN05421594_3138 [Chryseobacterium oleae]|uniref:Uncharacterized protein n=1 Tax=Chryseobacterium oleae TaxID=491207 RepID=A0A1I4ZPC3_CHROL|nr:hypothetical protein SAMN05421594_3138 [Chryseobacterium oleae]